MLLAIIPWALLLTRGRCVSAFATHVTFATLATLATLVTLATLFTHCFSTAYCCDKTSLSQEDTYTPPL
jgi:hypothetical protein